jgi:peptidoglycan/xylan/chitin deacetylase (PgdA/CDA1 family)
MMASLQQTVQKSALPYLFGRIIWGMPGNMRVAHLLGANYGLRCLLFHDVAERPSVFTNGLGVTLSPEVFEARIKMAAERYTPITLEDVLTDSPKTRLKKPPVLVTFDDAYESVARVCAPILRQYGVPAVMFATGSLIGNGDLALDNLICHALNTRGFDLVRSVASDIAGHDLPLASRKQLTLNFLPTLSQTELARFRAALVSATGTSSEQLAGEAQLYVSAQQLRRLAADGITIGNHTFSHVFCRSLRGEELDREIGDNKAHLEALTGSPVRAFSVPYGSAKDLTDDVSVYLKQSGHEATFLVESRANARGACPHWLNRVSVQSASDAEFFTEVELLPRIRSAKDRLSGVVVGNPRATSQISYDAGLRN